MVLETVDGYINLVYNVINHRLTAVSDVPCALLTMFYLFGGNNKTFLGTKENIMDIIK
jgi:hypothetical protein